MDQCSTMQWIYYYYWCIYRLWSQPDSNQYTVQPLCSPEEVHAAGRLLLLPLSCQDHGWYNITMLLCVYQYITTPISLFFLSLETFIRSSKGGSSVQLSKDEVNYCMQSICLLYIYIYIYNVIHKTWFCTSIHHWYLHDIVSKKKAD